MWTIKSASKNSWPNSKVYLYWIKTKLYSNGNRKYFELDFIDRLETVQTKLTVWQVNYEPAREFTAVNFETCFFWYLDLDFLIRSFYFTIQNALHWASKHGNSDVVKLIAGTYKADVNERTVSCFASQHLNHINR